MIKKGYAVCDLCDAECWPWYEIGAGEYCAKCAVELLCREIDSDDMPDEIECTEDIPEAFWEELLPYQRYKK